MFFALDLRVTHPVGAESQPHESWRRLVLCCNIDRVLEVMGTLVASGIPIADLALGEEEHPGMCSQHSDGHCLAGAR